MSTVSTTQVSTPLVTPDLVTPDLVTLDVKTFMKNNGFIQVHKEVRENTNGYPYITFINGKNEAENIYFSTKAGEQVKAGTPIAKGFFDKYLIADTINAQGENRTKIVRSGNSTRLEIDDLF